MDVSTHHRAPPAPRQHVAAAASAGAGVIHVVAAAPHASEGLLLAATFVVVGALQLTLAVLLAAGRGGSRLDRAAVGVHGIALAGWVLSRTVGLPAFLHPGVEPVGAADLTAAVFAVAAIALATWRLARPAPLRPSRPVSITVFTLAWVLAITGSAAGLETLTRAGHEHGHHAVGDHAHDHHGEDDGHPDDDAPPEDAADDGHHHPPGEEH